MLIVYFARILTICQDNHFSRKSFIMLDEKVYLMESTKKSFDRFYGFHNGKHHQFILKMLTLYIFVLLICSLILFPISPVINAEDEEDEDDEEDGDGSDGDSDSVQKDSSSSQVDPAGSETKKTEDLSNVNDINNEVNNDQTNTADTSVDPSDEANDPVNNQNDDSTDDSDSDNQDPTIDDSTDNNQVDTTENNLDSGDGTALEINDDNPSVDDKVNSNDNNQDSFSAVQTDSSIDEGMVKESSMNKKNESKQTNTNLQDLNDEDVSDVPSNGSEPTKIYEFQKTIQKEITNEDNNTDLSDDESMLEGAIGDIQKDEQISVETPPSEKPKNCIQKVVFTSAQNQQNVKLQVTNLKDKPVEIINDLNLSEGSMVYQYLDIKLTANQTYIGETGIKNMTFDFAIKRSWIENQSFDKYTVTMMRYHNESWQKLNTTYVNETNETIYYQAQTPGLSIFAVVGNKVVEDSDEVVVDSVSLPWWMPASIILLSTTTLGVVLVKKRFVYHP